MTDDNQNPDKNQIPQVSDSAIQEQNQEPSPETRPTKEEPKTIFETVTVEEKKPAPQAAPKELKPEEAPPDLSSPGQPASPGEPPMYLDDESGNRIRYLIIGGAALGFVLIFIFILFLIFGRRAEQKQVRLVYWGLWEDEALMQPLIDQYKAQNKNTTIQYQKMDPDQYREKLIARSKNKQDPPDIFRFHNTWLPEIKEIAAPIPQSVMSNSEFEQTFYPVQQKDLKVGDNYFGIPLSIDGLVLIYNDDLFKKAGINTPPVSWDEVINDYVGKLTVKSPEGQIITSGMALGTATNVDHFSDIFGLFLIQNGGDIKRLEQPEAAGALQSYREFAEPPDNIWDDTLPSSVVAFTQEKVAMIIAPSWQILTIKAANPEINLKVVPVPAIPGSKPVSIASYWVEGVSRVSENQLEAWKFLEFLSQKDNMTKLYELQAQSRPFGEPYSRVDLASILAEDEFVGAVIKQADSFVSIPTISRTFDSGLNDNIIQYLANAINATAQGVSYEEALVTAKQGVDQVLIQFQIITEPSEE